METTSLWWRIVAIVATLSLCKYLFLFNSNLALSSPSCSSRISPYLWPIKLSVKCATISPISFLLFRGIYTTYCTGWFDSHENSSSVSNPKDQINLLCKQVLCVQGHHNAVDMHTGTAWFKAFCSSESCLTSVGEVALGPSRQS